MREVALQVHLLGVCRSRPSARAGLQASGSSPASTLARLSTSNTAQPPPALLLSRSPASAGGNSMASAPSMITLRSPTTSRRFISASTMRSPASPLNTCCGAPFGSVSVLATAESSSVSATAGGMGRTTPSVQHDRRQEHSPGHRQACPAGPVDQVESGQAGLPLDDPGGHRRPDAHGEEHHEAAGQP